jgi:hypothetical protein
MGLAHHHVEVEPCDRGTKKDTRDIYTGYFMCLAPENEEGEEVEDLNEHAIEAINITWEEGEKTIVQAGIRNHKKMKPPCSSISQGSRGTRLFNAQVSKGEQSSTEHLYNRPYDPRSSNPNRTVKRARHKEVYRPVPRQVVRVGPKVTREQVRMLNHQRATRDTKMPQLYSRMGGWQLALEYPQPCIKEDNDEWGMAEELSQSTSTGAKYAQPHDSDAQTRAAPDNPLSKLVNFHSSGYIATKKGATIHPSPNKKESKNL